MKKLMALCLSVLMVLSMCSFTVMAEETEATPAAVTFEDIANGQPQNFVTSNLVLGTNDVITSSNEAVIATDGTVTRPLFEDAKVTISINGGEAVTVTVKAKTTNVLYANDFSTHSDRWTFNKPEANDASKVEEGVLKMVIGPTPDGNRTSNQYYAPASSGTGIVTMEFDMSNISHSNSGADIRIAGNWYDAQGESIGSFNTLTIARSYSSGFGETISGWVEKSISTHTVISYNPLTGELWGNATRQLIIFLQV